MAIIIEHEDIIDVRDIADVLDEFVQTLEDSEDAWDKEDARDTINEYRNALNQLGQYPDEDDIQAVADTWREFSNTGDVTVISVNYFTEYIEDMVKDFGYIDPNIPEFIRDNINWEGVAEALSVDYTEFRLDGHDYYLRLG